MFRRTRSGFKGQNAYLGLRLLLSRRAVSLLESLALLPRLFPRPLLIADIKTPTAELNPPIPMLAIAKRPPNLNGLAGTKQAGKSQRNRKALRLKSRNPKLKTVHRKLQTQIPAPEPMSPALQVNKTPLKIGQTPVLSQKYLQRSPQSASETSSHPNSQKMPTPLSGEIRGVQSMCG